MLACWPMKPLVTFCSPSCRRFRYFARAVRSPLLRPLLRFEGVIQTQRRTPFVLVAIG